MGLGWRVAPALSPVPPEVLHVSGWPRVFAVASADSSPGPGTEALLQSDFQNYCEFVDLFYSKKRQINILLIFFFFLRNYRQECLNSRAWDVPSLSRMACG